MSLEAGANFASYRIVERAGRGGMATVYKAYEPSLGRYVAIKALPSEYAEDAEFRERFQQEAMAIAKLRHPNILAVFHYGEDEGVTYIATEWIDGGTLKDQLGHPLPVEYVCRMLSPIASALDYAHARQLLHRDVKPSNILLQRDGTPVLADFGLARIMGSMPRLTKTGTAVGTPEYMAPEQAMAEPMGPPTDQYALAVVAYEALTGRVPFEADTPLAVLLAQVNKPLPLPRDINPSLRPAVEQVLFKGLAKSPADRYTSASQLVAALVEAERASDISPSPLPRPVVPDPVPVPSVQPVTPPLPPVGAATIDLVPLAPSRPIQSPRPASVEQRPDSLPLVRPESWWQWASPAVSWSAWALIGASALMSIQAADYVRGAVELQVLRERDWLPSLVTYLVVGLIFWLGLTAAVRWPGGRAWTWLMLAGAGTAFFVAGLIGDQVQRLEAITVVAVVGGSVLGLVATIITVVDAVRRLPIPALRNVGRWAALGLVLFLWMQPLYLFIGRVAREVATQRVAESLRSPIALGLFHPLSFPVWAVQPLIAGSFQSSPRPLLVAAPLFWLAGGLVWWAAHKSQAAKEALSTPSEVAE